MISEFAIEFSDIVRETLKSLSFKITDLSEIEPPNELYPDLLLQKDHLSFYCEIKFYRSYTVNASYIRKAAQILASYRKQDTVKHRLLVVSCVLPTLLKEEVYNSYNVVVWDRSNLANFLVSVGREDQTERLGILIMDSQQGLNTKLPYEDIDEDTERDPLNYFTKLPIKKISLDENKNSLIAELQNIKAGKKGWALFENKCIEILKYLFEKDLSVWKVQKLTDDGLSRFDMICRINSQDDFWKTIIHSFNSRYIIFEFKNYLDPLPQDMIYNTERYLFPKALRGTAIIIARNGAHPSSISAAKGALREHGKLILVLDESNLKDMIRKKEKGDSPNDYLSDKLDEYLITIAR